MVSAGRVRHQVLEWADAYATEIDVDDILVHEVLGGADFGSFDTPSDFMEGDAKRLAPDFYGWWRRRAGVTRAEVSSAKEAGADWSAGLRRDLAALASKYGFKMHRHHGKDKDHVTLELAFPGGTVHVADREAFAKHLCTVCGLECGVGQEAEAAPVAAPPLPVLDGPAGPAGDSEPEYRWITREDGRKQKAMVLASGKLQFVSEIEGSAPAPAAVLESAPRRIRAL
jgi:hypothetical protein